MFAKKLLVAGLVSSLLLAAVPVLANDTETHGGDNGTTTSVGLPVSAADLACAQTGVDKREVAVAAAFDVHYAALKAALTTRAAALHTAWALTGKNQRKGAVRDAWSAFQKAQKAAKKDFRTAQKAAWSQFNTDTKTCKPARGEQENRGADVQL